MSRKVAFLLFITVWTSYNDLHKVYHSHIRMHHILFIYTCSAQVNYATLTFSMNSLSILDSFVWQVRLLFTTYLKWWQTDYEASGDR